MRVIPLAGDRSEYVGTCETSRSSERLSRIATKNRPPLTRDAVVAAAIEVIDADGVQACTMRSVANRLGVEPMSLYWHVANKDDLLDGVIGKVLESISAPPAEGAIDPADWRGRLTEFATAFRRIVLSHPHVGMLMARRPATGYVATKRAAVYGLSNLEHAGFGPAQAIDVMRMVARLVLGTALADAAANGDPPARTAKDGPEIEALLRSLNPAESERLFALSLETFLNGIETTLPRNGSTPDVRGRSRGGDAPVSARGVFGAHVA